MTQNNEDASLKVTLAVCAQKAQAVKDAQKKNDAAALEAATREYRETFTPEVALTLMNIVEKGPDFAAFNDNLQKVMDLHGPYEARHVLAFSRQYSATQELIDMWTDRCNEWYAKWEDAEARANELARELAAAREPVTILVDDHGIVSNTPMSPSARTFRHHPERLRALLDAKSVCDKVITGSPDFPVHTPAYSPAIVGLLRQA